MIRHLPRVALILFGWGELFILSLILYPLSYLPRTANPRPWYTLLFRLWSNAWVDALGVDLKLHQKNRHPLPDHYILVANHPSAFEDIGIPALFNVRSLAKIEVRDWWIVGRISAAAGTIFVRRESRESRQKATAEMVRVLESGGNIALYPEGGVKGKRLYDHFRYGAFDISLKTGTPILPVFLHYEAQDNFHWSHQTLLQKIRDFITSPHNTANYYIYDAYDPAQFADKESYCESVYGDFLDWQTKYLD